MPIDINSALAASLQAVTKHWTAAKRQADRQQRVSERELERLRQARRPRQVSIKEAAYEVMPEAYRMASSNGRLPANARQIMYAARPYILAHASKPWGKRTDQHFTQHLLPDYIEAHPTETADWDVVFDDRGHLVEPHTGTRLGLGTLAVRYYCGRWTGTTISTRVTIHDVLVDLTRVPTTGPRNRYSAALFVEKEGFDALWDAIHLAERFDLAIMSTKGMSVTAARQLVERLSAAGVTIYVLHDFDKAGFSILHTLRSNTRRYRYTAPPRVVDLGLRLDDVRAFALESEPVEYDSKIDPRIRLRECGATEAEANFLVHEPASIWGGWSGERVELNAMTSDQLVHWLEEKLHAADVDKVVPASAALEQAYRRAIVLARIRKAVAETLANIDDTAAVSIPPDLATHVAERLQADATAAWDTVVWDMAEAAEDK
jgi:hypothetical protein